MGETKWTPGPWTASKPDQFGDCNINHPANSLAIGAVVSNLRSKTEVLANAHLIAAAPELYEALSAYELMADAPSAIEDMARTALAKARGEQMEERDG